MASNSAFRSYTNTGRNVSSSKGSTLKVDVLWCCELFRAADSRNRWDSPLFIFHKDEDLPLRGIEEALYERKAPPPNLSTQCQPLAATNFLYDLDKVTQGIVKSILNAQKLSTPGDFINIPEAEQKVS
ncbi:protein KTI12 homolog [Trichonephila clavipes]|nr:protein KTI12 homolog [Trichonephila clavipes]